MKYTLWCHRCDAQMLWARADKRDPGPGPCPCGKKIWDVLRPYPWES